MQEPTATSRHNNEQISNNMYAIIKLNKSSIAEDKYRIDHSNEPSRIHKSMGEAEQEANRLANKHPNSFFGIFRCEKAAVCSVNPVQFVKI